LYKNLGQGRFIDISSASGPAGTQPTAAEAPLRDFDNDGDIDVAIINMNEPPSLLRNDPLQNNWLKIKCIGTNPTAAPSAHASANHRQTFSINEVMSAQLHVPK